MQALKKIILGPVRRFFLYSRYFYLKLLGVDIDKSARVSLKAKVDLTNPNGVHIRSGSYLAFDSVILSHCFVRGVHCDTYILQDSFVGAAAIVLPGVSVGPNSIVAAGAVVTKNVPPNCIVAGNPARVIRRGIVTKRFGEIVDG